MTPLSIVSNAKDILRDNIVGLSSYSDKDWMMYINAALAWVVSVDSSANSVTESISLVAGTHQKIPNGGVRLMSLWSNAKADVRERIDGVLYYGSSPVRNTPLSEARDELYNWGSARQRTLVVNVVVNKDDPTHFMVYPPNDGNGALMATYAKSFAEVTAIDATPLPLGDKYLDAIVNYVVYRAAVRRLENGEAVNDRVPVATFYNMAKESLMLKAAADKQTQEKDSARA